MLGTHPVVTPSIIQLNQPCELYALAMHPWLDGSSGLLPTPVSAHQHGSSETSPTSREAAKASILQSTSPTLESLHSAQSSSSSSSSSGIFTRDGSTSNHQVASNATYASCPNAKAHANETQQYPSTTETVNEGQGVRESAAKQHKRRCVSASPVSLARTRWTSPDRFVSQRPRLDETSSYHVTKPPSTLRGRELHNRARDPSANPFRSFSESRSREASRRTPSSSYGLRRPRFVPSFVHGDDASPVNLDPRGRPDNQRNPSWGGFWNMGGTSVAQLSQLRGVTTVDGRRLASGTNAPLHTSAFLDDLSQTELLSSHETRVALALDIDQAARILTQPGKSLQPARTTSLEPFAMAYGNGRWPRYYSQNGTLSRPSSSSLTRCSTDSEDHEDHEKREDYPNRALPSA